MKLVYIVLGGVSFLVVACSPSTILEGADARASRQVQETAYVETAVFAGTQINTLAAMQSTADSAILLGTQLAQLQLENSQLQGTISAVTTFGLPVIPRFTPTLIPTATPLVPAADYQDLRTATEVDAQGCPVDKRGRFSENATRVYFTVHAFNVTAGARHQVRWLYDKELRYESTEWVADQNYADVCIYFWLEPSYTPFTAGLWAADFMVNGALFAEVPFELCVADELC